ncbi:HAMP domain-containing histidine kinase [Nostoc sp. FACHB-152]|uniref:sensor histidine kinase n=1 Tax=unclassified Nostoc TaxID=2593658 RepID=UPI001684A4DE|nr:MULTISPECIES: HAMP domain-containing sensor histidine kinase [unclassified Nostoc]MBD2449724.1 HAMP domain-containing histidine kinase [Nostoc sp. FACHB-152]MBD2469899.1 HAMP domain-containing histidine kinase [Nostoc sp. FACHB-145]
MQVTKEVPAKVLGTFTKNSHFSFPSFGSSELQSFCQLEIENLTNKYPIFWCRIVHYDPSIGNHQEVTHQPENQYISQETLAYLNSEAWLVNFLPSFTFSEIDISCFTSSSCYTCPLGYRNQKPEYILILAHQHLPLKLQEEVRRTAMLVSKYLDIYLETLRQKAEVQLLEHVLQRTGHQLRQPLGLIRLYAENLYLGLIDSPWQEQAAIIRESIQDLDTNLTDLIYCSQKAKLRVAPHDLKSLVAESIQGLKGLIVQKNLQVSYSETSDILSIDRLQMKQVFDNLLSNAVHFSPVSGKINCNWQIFQNEVLIQISDQGPGLSTDDLNKIFTPFYSRRLGGTGLGLTIAKKIVLDHHGSLWANNSPQGGAQFYISLPRSY